MNKYEWKQKMAKIKWANKQKGVGWNKTTIGVAADMIMAQKPEKPTERGKEPLSISTILKNL